MLKKIVDKSDLDMSTSEIVNGLEIDLIKHKGKPFVANAVKVTVENGSFFDSMVYQFQYGLSIFGNFYPIGKSSGKISYACLPYFDSNQKS